MTSSSSTTDSAAQASAAIVGAANVRPGSDADALDGVTPALVVAPGSAEEIAAVLKHASSAGLALSVRGGGTKGGWGNPPKRADIVLSMARLNQVLEHVHSDMTVTVQAGCTVAALQSALAKHGQRLAFDPLWPERATIGGALATNDSGSLRIRFGSLRDLIIGVTLALPDGTLAKSGGKVVKNVAGYDLPKLATGSLGTLGVITQATFRLHPLPRNTTTLTFAFTDVVTAQKFILAALDGKLAHTGLQLRAEAGRCEADIRFEGTTEGMQAQSTTVRAFAGGAGESSASDAVWAARQDLFSGAGTRAICKASVLPDQVADLVKAVENSGVTAWKLVHQAFGLGTLRLEAAADKLAAAIAAVRARVTQMGGSLVVLDCPAQEKKAIDVWGPPGDALPLMLRIKVRFDPAGTLNLGRFVGGI